MTTSATEALIKAARACLPHMHKASNAKYGTKAKLDYHGLKDALSAIERQPTPEPNYLEVIEKMVEALEEAQSCITYLDKWCGHPDHEETDIDFINQALTLAAPLLGRE